MLSPTWAFERLLETALISFALLAAGSAAVLCCRQPVRRQRIIVATFLACLVALALVSALPRDSAETSTAASSLRSGVELSPLPQGDVPAAALEEPPPPSENQPAAAPPGDTVAAAPGKSPQSIAAAPARGSTFPAATGVPGHPPAPARHPESSAGAPRAGSNPGAWPPLEIPIPSRALRDSILAGYGLGVAGFGLWWLAGWFGLRRVLRGARPAPESCRQLFRQITGPAGDRVALLVSPRAAQPFTCGWRRPAIVLPAPPCPCGPPGAAAEDPGDALRWSLSLEWSHVVRGDLRAWSLSGVVRMLFFYQPLCWWLRMQLRLNQDFLADAAAAGDAPPADYAEFLAARALGRPLALGLGIAAGKSELYRRIAMLVRHRIVLETRCSRKWTAAVLFASLAVTLLAARLGSGRFVRAAGEPVAGAAPVEQDEAPASTDAPAPSSVALEKFQPPRGKGAPPEATLGPPPELDPDSAARKENDEFRRLVEAVIARFPRRDPPLQVRFRREIDVADHSTAGEYVALFSPTGWLLMPLGESHEFTTLVRDGRSAQTHLRFPLPGLPDPQAEYARRPDMLKMMSGQRQAMEGVKAPLNSVAAARSNSGVGATVTIRYAELAQPILDELTPYALGTIYYESGRDYVREHARSARLTFRDGRGQPVQGVRTDRLVLEWDVNPADAARAFPSANRFLARGGTLCLWLDPDFYGALTRIEGVDPFGTRQLLVENEGFGWNERLPRYPRQTRISAGGATTTITVLSIDAPADEALQVFTLPVPARVAVIDERIRRGEIRDDGRVDRAKTGYLFRTFQTAVAYPQGFPDKLWAEIDRDVLPWNDVVAAGVVRTHQSELALTGGLSLRLAVPEVPVVFDDAAQAFADSRKAPDKRSAKMAPPAAMKGSSALPGGKDATSKTASREPVTADDRAARQSFRYRERSFESWRETLLNDLDSETRVKALEAIAAFAANGYAAEAVECVVQTLAQEKQFAKVRRQVLDHMVRVLNSASDTSISTVENLFASREETDQRLAREALENLVKRTDAAVPLAVRVVGDGFHRANLRILETLIQSRLESDGVRALAQAAIRHHHRTVRRAAIEGLIRSTSSSEATMQLLLDVIESPRDFQIDAAVALAGRGPNVEAVRQALTEFVMRANSRNRVPLIRRLDGAQPTQLGLILPAMTAAYEDHLRSAVDDADLAIAIADAIGRFGPDGREGVPLLVHLLLVNERHTIAQLESHVRVFEALIAIGTPANWARPALETLRDKPPRILEEASPELRSRWLQLLHAALKGISDE